MRLAEILAALGVAQNYVRPADVEKHHRTALACIRAFFFPVKVLSPDRDLRTLCRCNRRAQINVRGANHNFLSCVASHEREKLAKEFASLSGILVHLTVSGDELLSMICLF